MKIEVFDSTLRDGAQGESISFSLEDKRRICECLSELGVLYIEAGNPTSNPKDVEFFSTLKDYSPSKIVAFGSTRRKGTKVEEDAGVRSLIDAKANVVAIFGKCWDLHVTDVLQTTFEENGKMIADTIKYLKANGKEVIFDAEHFFDGYKANPDFAMDVLKIAKDAGADKIVLCDTNGGCMSKFVYDVTERVCREIPGVVIGIHCHNDSGLAVANTIAAVEAGATHIQGTFLGFGERCGNANLSTLIANLQVKMGHELISQENLSKLTETANKMAEIANTKIRKETPYIGRSAFAHKAGMHADGVMKNSTSFEHIEPEMVGNSRRFLMSEMAGRAVLLQKAEQIDSTLTKDDPRTQKIMKKFKEMELLGYQFDNADATFEMIVKKELGSYKPFFSLHGYNIICDNFKADRAVIKIEVDGETEITAAEGDGPVNAIDKALRCALERFYPVLKEVSLDDYKVRVLEGTGATESKVRVMIDTTDKKETWTTIGVSTDIIEASFLALVDSLEYKLMKGE